jgi:transcription termination factor Rho
VQEDNEYQPQASDEKDSLPAPSSPPPPRPRSRANGPSGSYTQRNSGEYAERPERPDRGERYDRSERQERGPSYDRGERPERGERYERGGRYDRNRGGDRGVQRVFPARTYQEREQPAPKTFQNKDGETMPFLSVKELEEKTRTELVELAKMLEIKDLQRIKKQDLIFPILEAQAKAAGLSFAIGVLDMLPEGYGFLRRENMRPGAHDVYISQSQIRRFELRTGDLIAGQIRDPKDNEKYHGILKVEAVNGQDPEALRGRAHFDKLVPIYPDNRLKMETSTLEMCGRVFDLFCPIGKGQRALIVSPPKAGKTTLLKKIANAIASNHPECDLFALLVDERPEEVTDMRRSIEGEVISSTFDEHPENHTAVAELTLERCKRLVELGHDVVILLDSITRLARAWNQVMPSTGRTLSGGLDTSALHRPKRFFGAARNIEGGGSLTIVATALIETGSKMDDVIFEEFKGTGNMEINLVRKLADSRIFPAVDIKRSGTRHEELLLSEIELRKVVMLRRATAVLGTQEMTELILERFRRTDSNEEFLKSVTKEAMSLASAEQDR